MIGVPGNKKNFVLYVVIRVNNLQLDLGGVNDENKKNTRVGFAVFHSAKNISSSKVCYRLCYWC